MIKKFLIILSCFIFVSVSFYGINVSKIEATTVSFVEVFGTGSLLSGTSNARSPLRSSSGLDFWARVNSKNNQPRAEGTNPHQGTDLQGGADTKVYPILPGKVVHVNHTLSSQLGSVTLNHDINGVGIYDNVYVRYLHIDPNGDATTGIKVNDTFNTTQSIGTIDTFKKFTPHLHFQRTDITNTYSYKLYNFYRYVTEWFNGSHLDFITGDEVYSSSNMLYVNAYAATDNSINVYAVTGIDFYYKIGTSGTWTKSSTGFTLDNSYTNRWKINLKTASGGATGNTIYYYIVANRANDPTFPGSYKSSFFPQYYTQPTPPLSASNANIIARSYILN